MNTSLYINTSWHIHVDELPMGAWSNVERKSNMIGATHLRHTLTPTHVGQKIIVHGKPGKLSALHVMMSAAEYVDSICYFQKQQTVSEVLPDPYSLVNEQWIDDGRRWPSLEFGDVYT